MATALTPRQVSTIREWVGDEVPLAVLQEKWDLTGDIDLTILSVLRHRRSQMIVDEPSVMVVDGLTINQSMNISALDALIESFAKKGTTGRYSTGVAHLVRRGYR